MQHGIFTMSNGELHDAVYRAIKLGAFATSKRLEKELMLRLGFEPLKLQVVEPENKA